MVKIILLLSLQKINKNADSIFIQKIILLSQTIMLELKIIEWLTISQITVNTVLYTLMKYYS